MFNFVKAVEPLSAKAVAARKAGVKAVIF